MTRKGQPRLDPEYLEQLPSILGSAQVAELAGLAHRTVKQYLRRDSERPPGERWFPGSVLTSSGYAIPRREAIRFARHNTPEAAEARRVHAIRMSQTKDSRKKRDLEREWKRRRNRKATAQLKGRP